MSAVNTRASAEEMAVSHLSHQRLKLNSHDAAGTVDL